MSEEDADKLIAYLAQYIKAAGLEFGVDPATIACCIYAEQVLNVNWLDSLFDSALYFLDTSVGVGQVRISTARKMEDLGYIEKSMPVFDEPFNEVLYKTRNKVILDRLNDPKENIRYVAAYLRYWQDRWNATLDISQNPAILATLYNLGDNANSPNTNPHPNSFGNYVATVYTRVGECLK